MSVAVGPVPLDYDAIGLALRQAFDEAQSLEDQDAPVEVDASLAEAVARVFHSSTMAYREVLLGCAMVALTRPEADLTKPCAKHGDGAFNGRTLDERVINPFLRAGRFPCSKAPFLSAFRRSVRFLPETAVGLRDRPAYEAFLACLAELQDSDHTDKQALTRYICRAFLRLRAASQVELTRLRRLSVEQLKSGIRRLLDLNSGGRIPVFLIAAALQALDRAYGLGWRVEVQEINAADAASGAGGDLTVRDAAGRCVMAIEVTERPIEAERIVATFDTKIAPHGIEDYLLLHGPLGPSEAARQAAFPYFAQGHDISFHETGVWLADILSLVGEAGRAVFLELFLERLSGMDVPVALKLAWNRLAGAITRGPEV